MSPKQVKEFEGWLVRRIAEAGVFIRRYAMARCFLGAGIAQRRKALMEAALAAFKEVRRGK